MDRTNVRTLACLDRPCPSLVTLDLSFISLRAVLPASPRLAPGAEVVALFKPQFELAAGRRRPRRGGARPRRDQPAALADSPAWRPASLGAGTAARDPCPPACAAPRATRSGSSTSACAGAGA